MKNKKRYNVVWYKPRWMYAVVDTSDDRHVAYVYSTEDADILIKALQAYTRGKLLKNRGA